MHKELKETMDYYDNREKVLKKRLYAIDAMMFSLGFVAVIIIIKGW